MPLKKSQQLTLSKLIAGGNSSLGVTLGEGQLGYLISVTARDLDVPDLPDLPRDVPDLYERVPSASLVVDNLDFLPAYERLLELVPDADTYFYCLGSLLKARLKYERILQSQPTPSVEQVAPRSLLQFGHLKPSALAAFLFWRKWIFDIDNRAGQETGYLFEPILAQAIGGVPFSAKKSPVKRVGTSAGRQVDCIRDVPGSRKAYELKLRVTIAASGQGRWAEELSFPADCRGSGFTPVLVVFDGTPNPKLTELTNAFLDQGGEVYVADQAWAHLDDEAGPVMSRFIEKYVRVPIDSMIHEAPTELPAITFAIDNGQLIVSVNEDQLVITRVTEEGLEGDPDDLPDDIDESVGGV